MLKESLAANLCCYEIANKCQVNEIASAGIFKHVYTCIYACIVITF